MYTRRIESLPLFLKSVKIKEKCSNIQYRSHFQILQREVINYFSGMSFRKDLWSLVTFILFQRFGSKAHKISKEISPVRWWKTYQGSLSIGTILSWSMTEDSHIEETEKKNLFLSWMWSERSLTAKIRHRHRNLNNKEWRRNKIHFPWKFSIAYLK